MKLKFIKTKDPDNRFDQSELEFTTDHVTLDDILIDFTSFLRGCGFTIDGDLDVFKDED